MSTEEIKEENEKKPDNKGGSAKQTAIQCGALILGAILLCTVMIKGSSGYSKKILERSENTPFAFIFPKTEKTEPYNPGGESFIVDSVQAGEDSSDSEANEFDVTTAVIVENKDNAIPSASDMNTAQIVSIYNDAANGAKKNAKSIKQNFAKTTLGDDTKISNRFLKSVADPFIKRYTGEDKKKHNAVYTTAADKNAYFPVNGQSWASRLTADDVKNASITESDGTYTIKLVLKDDSQANLKAGEGHMGKAVSVVTKEQVADSAGMKLVKEDSIKITHCNGVVKATVDKQTGRLKTANFSYEWKLAFSTGVFNSDAVLSFGTEEDFVINW